MSNTVNIGDVYNELTVIAEDYEREKLNKNNSGSKRFYICRCSCGKTTSVGVYELLRGSTKSCGHLRKTNNRGKHTKDLTGLKVNDLTVLEKDTKITTKSGKHSYWRCKCNLCGNEKSIRSSDLISAKVYDCGCNKSKRISDGMVQNILGQTFGHLYVVERDLSIGYNSGQHVRWLCKCNLCGRIESVSSQMLTLYGKDRCKICNGVSMGENKIIEILDSNGIPYIHDKPYLNCRYPDTGGVLRFDFRIIQHSDCDYIIEFDGQQHYKEVPMYDDSLSFKDRQNRDLYKNIWCEQHNIPIIRIPYTRLKQLNVKDLQLNTTNYLIK